MLFSNRLRNSSRGFEVSQDRIRRQAERAPAFPIRLKVQPGKQVTLRHVERRLERGRDRPIDRKQADKRPKQQCAIDQHAAQDPGGPGRRARLADRLRCRGENGQSSNSLHEAGFNLPAHATFCVQRLESRSNTVRNTMIIRR